MENTPARREWNASVELFPKDFSRFVLPQNLGQLMSKTNAHTFRTYADFAKYIEPAAESIPEPKKRSTGALKRIGISALLVVAALAMILTADGSALGVTALIFGLLLGFFATCVGFFSTIEFLGHLSSESNRPTAHQRLTASLGDEPASALPVFIVDRLTMTAEENDVLDQCLGLYNYAQANQLPLSVDHWRALTQTALAQTRHARHVGEPRALQDLRASIERLEL